MKKRELNKIDYPFVDLRKGKGVFSVGNEKLESEFYLYHYPDRIIFRLERSEQISLTSLFESEFLWSLQGELDSGDSIKSEKLVLVYDFGKFIEFMPMEEVFIGSEIQKIDYAEFPLIGVYEGDCNFKINGWKIEFKYSLNESKYYKWLSNTWKIQSEGKVLRLTKSNADKNEFLDMASAIKTLLSLAYGNEIAFNRQFYFTEKNSLEVWRQQMDEDFGIHFLIDSNKIGEYLEHALKEYEQLDKEERKSFFRAINYLNSGRKGYLEDRSLRICQAWELIANYYFPNETISPELNQLKIELKKVVKAWTKLNPTLNENGILTDRISKTLSWEKYVNQLNSLAESVLLDTEALNINFSLLRQIRDSVAHTGRFPEDHNSKEIFYLVESAILGLRIILLRKLNFEGDIWSSRDNFLVRDNINKFLKSSPLNA